MSDDATTTPAAAEAASEPDETPEVQPVQEPVTVPEDTPNTETESRRLPRWAMILIALLVLVVLLGCCLAAFMGGWLLPRLRVSEAPVVVPEATCTVVPNFIIEDGDVTVTVEQQQQQQQKQSTCSPPAATASKPAPKPAPKPAEKPVEEPADECTNESVSSGLDSEGNISQGQNTWTE